ncbi:MULTISPECIES: hypothetical protein [Burkholderia]|uniref:hypothetical protein n=1 Tax=Burkholderia TaxID=32008 RepID=UPI0004813CBB|nr:MULTISPECIES: hypothetical protein [Burkholderia]ALK31129.1 lipoprotein [Burkholderia plantarii]WLE59767.1 hypothetical protein GIY62_03580 [Burkholderia plantarii]GLZ17242.1 hypothetical protein Bpla01_07720 [Burkholderia plantarii]
MRGALVLSILAVLTACGRHEPVLTVDALARDPQQLYALRHRCVVAHPSTDNATCRLMDSAYARRFFLGLGGANEYQTLAELPPIPASFEASQGDRP